MKAWEIEICQAGYVSAYWLNRIHKIAGPSERLGFYVYIRRRVQANLVRFAAKREQQWRKVNPGDNYVHHLAVQANLARLARR